MNQKATEEHAVFTKALRKVLSVSHEELQARIERDKQERQQRRKKTSDRASREKD